MENFIIRLRDNRIVYMDSSSMNSEYNTIVKVCPDKFRLYWKKEPYPLEPTLIFGGEKEWREDYKFGRAERGFSFGKNNPVPLPRIIASSKSISIPIKERKFFFSKVVGYREEVLLDYVGIENGITRIIWLLANGADYIPILCNEKKSDILKRFAGIVEGA
ncbi:plasmid fertility inhibition factor family protein [Aliivibrio fischeri]|uniref:plasmid fertility inhibition factor family protein n=1 Tax=Aliivibrio fischeri TaxID=668 RepID=UPI0007C43737|nr:hypothetical protein [Aliivibrio fischeri]